MLLQASAVASQQAAEPGFEAPLGVEFDAGAVPIDLLDPPVEGLGPLHPFHFRKERSQRFDVPGVVLELIPRNASRSLRHDDADVVAITLDRRLRAIEAGE